MHSSLRYPERKFRALDAGRYFKSTRIAGYRVVPAENVVRVPKARSAASFGHDGQRLVGLKIHVPHGSDDELSYAARE